MEEILSNPLFWIFLTLVAFEIGNIIFRTLVLVNLWPSCGAVTFGIDSVYIDTSRDQNVDGYLRSLKLAYNLANI